MEELQRQQSLQAMGVLPLVASRVLPGAKPSVQLPVVVAVPQQEKQATVSEPSNSAVRTPGKSAGVGKALEILGASAENRSEAKPADTKKRQASVETKVRSGGVATHANPRFKLLCLNFDTNIAFVIALDEEIPEVAKQLCAEIAAVMMAARQARLLSEHVFQWPLQQAGLSKDFRAAQDVFQGVLASQFANAGQLILLGDIPVRLMSAESAAVFQWIDCDSYRCLVLPELSQLMADPMLKKQLLLSILNHSSVN